MEKRTKKERDFQKQLVQTLKKEFEGSIVMKEDASHIQGIPDILILYEDKWAALECKKTKDAHHQPNQDYYISKMNEMSFAEFIYPENADIVMQRLKTHLKGKANE